MLGHFVSPMFRTPVAELAKPRLVVHPVRRGADAELEVDAFAEHPLHADAGVGADRLHGASAGADEDFLVGFARDDDADLDPRDLRALVEALDDDGHAVRDLLARVPEDLLADELRHEEARGLIGERLFVVHLRLDGQERQELAEEAVDAVVPARADGDDRMEPAFFADGREDRQERAALSPSRSILLSARMVRPAGRSAPCRPSMRRRRRGSLLRVDDEDDGVGVVDSLARGVVHEAPEAGPRLVEAGRVDEEVLRVLVGAHAANDVACRSAGAGSRWRAARR